MNKISNITAIGAIITALAACSVVTPHHHSAADAKPTTRLTLIPQSPGTIQAKINEISSRALITKDYLTQPLQLFIIDPTLTDFHLITPQSDATGGLYSFQFTPKPATTYRVWADINPTEAMSKKQAEEFPQADLGKNKAGNINKAEVHQASGGGYNFTLSFDKAPTDDDESIGTVKISGNGSITSGEIVGFYDDFRTVTRMDLNKDGTFHLTPKKPGFIKLFVVVKIGGKEITVPFGVNAAKND